jgi:hypothetical protein
VDFLAKTGVAKLLLTVIDPNQDITNINPDGVIILVFVSLFMAGIFMIVQSYYSNRNGFDTTLANVIIDRALRAVCPCGLGLNWITRYIASIIYFIVLLLTVIIVVFIEIFH